MPDYGGSGDPGHRAHRGGPTGRTLHGTRITTPSPVAPPADRGLLRYLGNLAAGKVVLWCFLVWYLVTIYQHFDPTPGIWLNALVGSLAAVAGGVSLPRAVTARRG